jgi:hypothetical protein
LTELVADMRDEMKALKDRVQGLEDASRAHVGLIGKTMALTEQVR